jgi:hypothetical protein
MNLIKCSGQPVTHDETLLSAQFMVAHDTWLNVDRHTLTLGAKSCNSCPSGHLYITPILVDLLWHQYWHFPMYHQSMHAFTITSHKVDIAFCINSNVLCIPSFTITIFWSHFHDPTQLAYQYQHDFNGWITSTYQSFIGLWSTFSFSIINPPGIADVGFCVHLW